MYRESKGLPLVLGDRKDSQGVFFSLRKGESIHD